MIELSLVELESELSAVLPPRNLMCHRRRRKVKHCSCGNGGSNGISADHGSAANGNVTNQTNSNPQTVVNTGRLHDAGIHVDSHNSNSNSNTQTGTPINFGIA
ncbi:MAG TPA: hypothetical protein VF120_04225 [Ktedonobacterales bacterium]